MRADRRQLLAGTAGLAMTSRLTPAAEAGPARLIPSTGRPVPAVGLGSCITFHVGDDPVMQDQCAEIIAAFVDEGGGMIDSARRRA